MKKILFIVLCFIFGVSGVQASEITGQISTNPNLPNNIASTAPIENIPLVNKDEKLITSNNSGGSGSIFQKSIEKGIADKTVEEENVKVLGIKHYPDNSLLRGSDHYIYLISNKIKKPIHNLKELAKYRGQVIYEATDEELSVYQTKEHLDGDLIRIKGAFKIYVIRDGRKQYIKNLEELRRYYFGLEIFNITQEEMDLY